ncbi:MAG: RHS repeat domain-containing protein, partial [Bacteroidota bacterium]
KDDEWTGVTGSHLDFGARIYDSRINRWLSVDPKARKSPGWTGYNFVKNSPLIRIDPDGEEDVLVKQTRSSDETTAESTWLVYETGTFDDASVSQLRKMSSEEIIKQYGKPITQRKGSSLPDDPFTPEKGNGNATIKQGKYSYQKGEFSSGMNVLWLSEGKGEGVIGTVYRNPKSGGEKKAVGVAAHAGEVEWQKEAIMKGSTKKEKGSKGCPTCTRFGSLYENLEEEDGNFIIVRDEKNSNNSGDQNQNSSAP